MQIQNSVIRKSIDAIFADTELHVKQVESIYNAVLGVLYASQAGVANIGRALAAARGTIPKHGIKQFDRFLSNDNISLKDALVDYLKFVIGNRSKITICFDWTEYADGHHQHRIAINLVTKHGRATPLIWKTINADSLKGHRNDLEDLLLRTFKYLMPKSIKQVIVLADRGFGDIKLYEMLTKELGFDYVIRFRDCIAIRDNSDENRKGKEWVPCNGKARLIANARVTSNEHIIPAVVCVKRVGMKDSWILASSLTESSERIIKLYSRRFTIEETFRDEKDCRLGFGSLYVNIKRPERRDKLCLVIALATILLTFLGHSGEQLGLDRGLRANTAKKRTHSLVRQGREYLRGMVGKVENAVALLVYYFEIAIKKQLEQSEEWGTI